MILEPITQTRRLQRLTTKHHHRESELPLLG
ncbi:Uncharacterised protein [Mycobacteroides abscessus subsp. abscessus]|nr:Uncharacterised protein [Mycobacteroides abscessus subsp. abscessus]SKV07699.1 Uncharacterised protein [Mycobacteroides abscessus subsp. abscessus]